ncbi:hypothetical protein SCUP234_10367 [Seiridium cupressi]
MKHKPVNAQLADNLGTLMGVDASKKHKEKTPHHVKPETADGLSNLMGVNVKPTSHENQLRGRQECTGSMDKNKADAVLGADVSGGKSRDGSRETIGGKAKKLLGV